MQMVAILAAVFITVVAAAATATGDATGGTDSTTTTTVFEGTALQLDQIQLNQTASNRFGSTGGPTTTVPPKPSKPSPQCAPETEFTAWMEGIAPDGTNKPYRIVSDRHGKPLAVGRPGEVLQSVGGGSLALLDDPRYQTDRVILNDNTTENTYNVDLWVYVAPTSARMYDPETAVDGQRASSGYFWYNALQVSVGKDPSSNLYGLHAGLIIGQHQDTCRNEWYFDWSGYNAAGEPVLPVGGTNAQHLAPEGRALTLSEDTWYRVRIWRGERHGKSYNWDCWVTEFVNYQPVGPDQYCGRFILWNTPTISNAMYWTEIYEPPGGFEPSGPGFTNYWGTHNIMVEYRDADHGADAIPYKRGDVSYMQTAENTNLRCVSPLSRYTIDDRMVPRVNEQPFTLFNNP